MRLLVAAVGKLKQGPERQLCAAYLERAEAAGRGLGFGPVAQIELSESRQQTAESRKAAEAASLLEKIPTGETLICLDPKGKTLSSEAFAQQLADWRDGGATGAAFVIGGADGLGLPILEKADLTLSLGKMTLPHGLARIVLAEQLYRAITILAGHPYHRG
ncbi:23S rRNA (pseudouridine(1915)-N(3))-methyltransferase RlmH [Methyloligella sp. 2.7D]|uniref:23S rRNA (pseudouridine(1915)-N(3))-methyltransferase RlmH n=1 Tax=unclassified Methyloligella TaxID=2625955 RepID=UPI00157C4D37|nr:23S rRNA (pseudouridine(1915)-N(3))-methyltransferase RlmH [Methyloligella sp. GL2]QKP78671.1 23S rRNA (pseudouridine(1915)-N(3))-methyltransferase RlmH [Methyloligella sp. GL2]